MMIRNIFGALLLSIVSIHHLATSLQLLYVFAGQNNKTGHSGDGGSATSSRLKYPSGVFAATDGTVYFCDTSNAAVRKVSSTYNIITNFAGGGVSTATSIAATSALLTSPKGVWADTTGAVYFTDSGTNYLKKVSTSGIISNYAGTGTAGYNNDSIAATSASLNAPTGIIGDGNGAIYIADTNNHRVRKISLSGIITTYAGTGVAGYTADTGVAATSSPLNSPLAVGLDSNYVLFIGDSGNCRIRKVLSGSPSTIVTVAGSGTWYVFYIFRIFVLFCTIHTLEFTN